MKKMLYLKEAPEKTFPSFDIKLLKKKTKNLKNDLEFMSGNLSKLRLKIKQQHGVTL